jgi:hypothetical protein
MRHTILALFAVFSLTLCTCNRGSQQIEVKEDVTRVKKDLSEIQDLGAETIAQISSRITLSEEQKAKIIKMAGEIDFGTIAPADRSKVVRNFRREVSKVVLTETQMKAAKNN